MPLPLLLLRSWSNRGEIFSERDGRFGEEIRKLRVVGGRISAKPGFPSPEDPSGDLTTRSVKIKVPCSE